MKNSIKNNFKKFIVLALVGMFSVLSLIGCGTSAGTGSADKCISALCIF